MMPSISDIIGRVISVISMVLIGVGFLMLIRTIKKSSRVRASSLLMSMGFSVVMLLFNILVLRSSSMQWWFPLILIFGAGFGFAWGTTTSLSLQEKQVLGKRSVLYIYFWLASMLVTQVLAFFAKNNVVSFGLAGMFFSTGASLGTNSNILYRMRRLVRSDFSLPSAEDQSTPVSSTETVCQGCGFVIKENEIYCSRCGFKTGTAITDKPNKGWIVGGAAAGAAALAVGGFFLVQTLRANRAQSSEDLQSAENEAVQPVPISAQQEDTADAVPTQVLDTPQPIEPSNPDDSADGQMGNFISVSFDSASSEMMTPLYSEEFMHYFNAEGLGIIESRGYVRMLPVMVFEKKMGDFDAFFDFMMPEAYEDSACGFVFRSEGNITDSSKAFYALFLYPFSNEVRMAIWIDGEWVFSEVREPDPPIRLDYEMNTVQLEVSGESMKVYMNDAFVGNFNEGTLTEPGYWGLFLYPSGAVLQGEVDYAIFDELLVIEK